MKKLVSILLAALLVLSLATVAFAEAKEDADITIAVVPKSLDNAIFLDAQAAAMAKGEELGINVQWVGPTTSDAGPQVTVIEGLIEKHVDGILIS